MATNLMPPQLIGEAFAAKTNDKIIPPVSADSAGKNVSQDNGFPIAQSNSPINQGQPVSRLEFNGILNLYTQHTLWLQCGGRYTFDPAVASAIGGYPIGARLYDQATGLDVINMKDSNTDNFITDRTTLNPLSWNWYSTVPVGTFIQTIWTNASIFPLGFLPCNPAAINSKTTYAALWAYAVANNLVTTVLDDYQNVLRGYFLDRGGDNFSTPNLISKIFLAGSANYATQSGDIGKFQAGNVGTHTHTATTDVVGGDHTHIANQDSHGHAITAATFTGAKCQAGSNDTNLPSTQTLYTDVQQPAVRIEKSGSLTLTGSTTIAANAPGGANVPDSVSYAYFIKY